MAETIPYITAGLSVSKDSGQAVSLNHPNKTVAYITAGLPPIIELIVLRRRMEDS